MRSALVALLLLMLSTRELVDQPIVHGLRTGTLPVCTLLYRADKPLLFVRAAGSREVLVRHNVVPHFDEYVSYLNLAAFSEVDDARPPYKPGGVKNCSPQNLKGLRAPA